MSFKKDTTATPFTLETLDDVKNFEQRLKNYTKRKTGMSLPYSFLENAFKYCQNLDHGGKLFSAVFDIHINCALMYREIIDAGGTWNENFSKAKNNGIPVLKSTINFEKKMDIHRHNTAFIFRYRAMWDKLMGLLVLYFYPDRYDSFVSSQSRKKAFGKIWQDHHFVTPGFLADFAQRLTAFDNTFRTPEAHGTGSLRKWSFTMHSLDETPQIDLIRQWNYFIEIFPIIEKIFLEVSPLPSAEQLAIDQS
ncbi:MULTISPECIES: hypothetical protein [unclassified Duganella]|uniref:hypothetical protein n=1 Tax=unclassified Duganella TaxID=2636909 RepID=UPI00088E671C|nr:MULTISPECIES: hypothetical protein [unclassified Duganella]SDG06678.1 hypothetical protein SAMN05216320_102545 [Duganella sp. OV458]SDI98474.1 hypothetical protein SAMN05428973_1026 [Duganella sp. OV510]